MSVLLLLGEVDLSIDGFEVEAERFFGLPLQYLQLLSLLGYHVIRYFQQN